MTSKAARELDRATKNADLAARATAAVALQATDPAAYVAALRALHAEGATYALLADATGKGERTISYTIKTAKGAYKRTGTDSKSA